MIVENGTLNPYPGPRPFERGEQNLFFGRDREVKELLSLIIAHRVVVLYAQSGAGKTSLLNAGLAPLLTEEGFEILPVARVRGFEPEDIDLSDIANIYVFNTLVGWSEDKAEPAPLMRASIASFLREREHLEDEFEEPLPRLAIFDQFEELFTFYPERWKEREDFFRQVVDALEADPLLRVLFVMREDYLARLVSYNRLFAERLRARYRMERLRQEAATMAVEKPLSGTGRSFAEGVASSLVQELLSIHVESAPGETVKVAGEYVEPVQLQVVCQSLWESLPPDVTVITAQHLQTFGDVEEALKGFYERAIEIAGKEAGVSRIVLREWFSKELITPAGTRGTVFQGREDTGGIPNSAVEILENQHIIRAEMRAGARWYELTHDRLIEPIRKSNEVWLQRRRLEEQRQETEAERRRAEEQTRIATRFRYLTWGLVIVFLVASFFGVYSYYQKILADSAKASAEIAKAEAQNQARIAERRREEAEQAKVAEAEQRQLAEKQAGIAKEERERAEQAKKDAEERRKEAEAAKKDAEKRREEAERQARIAEEKQKEAEDAKAAEAEQRQLAQKRYKIALARQLAAQAGFMLEKQSEPWALRGLLAVESVKRLHSFAEENPDAEDDGKLGRLRDFKSEAAQVLREVLHSGPAIIVHQIEHKEEISVAFSSDGRYLATAGGDMTARVWDVSNGQEQERMEHEDSVNSVCFSPDGRYLATASDDRTARVWEWRESTEKPVARMEHEDSVNSVCFSPDGGYVATASDDKTARVWEWEVSTEKPVASMEHEGNVRSVCFSPDGSYVATASEDKSARVWEVSSGREVAHMERGGNVRSVCFSPDGSYVATASDDKTARVWEWAVSTDEKPVELEHKGNVRSVCFSPDGSYVATASEDGTARVWEWEVSTEEPVASMEHDGRINSICFSPAIRYFNRDAIYVLATSGGNTIRVWTFVDQYFRHKQPLRSVVFSTDGKYLATMGENTAWVREVSTGEPVANMEPGDILRSICFSPDGRRLATASEDSTARVWEASTGKPVGNPMKHGGKVYSVCFSPDGNHLATASEDGTARVWEASIGEPVGNPMKHEDIVNFVCFSPDGRYVATASRDKTARVWEWKEPTKEPAELKHGDNVCSVCFSPDGSYVATASEDGTAQVWEVSTGEPAGNPMKHGGIVNSICFSPDCTYVATASEDSTALVWEWNGEGSTKNQKKPAELKHEGNVRSVCFSPDGRYVATASEDNTVRMWEVPSGREVALMEHGDKVYSVCFSPDGKCLATASADKTARIWHLRSEDLVKEACPRLARELTEEEWGLHIGD